MYQIIIIYSLCLLFTATIVLGQQNNNDFEIRTLTGEPDYKSVNLTWGIEDGTEDDEEDEPAANDASNSTAIIPKSFTVFYCELQTWGAHRCKSKILEDNEIDSDLENKQYTMTIDNLRMATKYSFHVKPRTGKQQKATGRADLGDNGLGPNGVYQGQTIIVPTKGFSAHATKCLPHASEIEVETGPYFGGRIVAEGGADCGIQGEYESAKNTYVMRIDHEKCGSQVDHETLTVKTFITVQENLGIFTHSTRRFLVVCTYQPDTLTVRASFSVPGKGGASAYPQPNWESDRESRNRKFRMVGKSSLVLKEDSTSDEVSQFPTESYNIDDDDSDSEKPIGDIVEVVNGKESKNDISRNSVQEDGVVNFKLAKFARLVDNRQVVNEDDVPHVKSVSANLTGLAILIMLSVILIGALSFLLYKETFKRQLRLVTLSS